MDIQADSKMKSMRLTDVKNFRSVYTNGNLQFDSIMIETLRDNYEFLLADAETIPWNERYKFHPEYVAIDKYNDSNLWFIICHMNHIYCMEDFVDLSVIIVPTLTSIMKIISNFESNNINVYINPGGLL